MRDNKPLYTIVVFVVILLIELKFEIITSVFSIQISNLHDFLLDFFSILFNISLAFLGLLFLHGSKPKSLLKEMGAFNKSFLPAIVFAFFSSLWIIFVFLGEFCNCDNVSLISIILVFGFAIEEEILFRGFVLSQLYTRARWGFLPAVSIYPLLFAVKDLLYHANFINSIIQFIYLLIFTLWLSWIFLEWGGNIWITITLHLSFRLIAFLFGVDFAEINSDYFAVYIMQSFIVFFSVYFTIKYAHQKSKRFRVTGKNLFLQP